MIKLRHKKFPLVIMYREPMDGWEAYTKDTILEDIRENGFDNFVLLEEELVTETVEEEKAEEENENR